MRRVLVTRPEPGASATGRRLAERGFAPIVLPLTRIVPLPEATLSAGAFDAVVATSANAFRHAPGALLAQLGSAELHVVGTRTQAAAGRAAATVCSDSAALAACLMRILPTGARVAYLAGRVRRHDLEHALAGAGHSVEIAEVYDTARSPDGPEEIGTKIGAGPLWAALVYSRRGGEVLGEAIAAMPMQFASSTLVCISPDAAQPLASSGPSLVIADVPNENGMLACLDRLDGE